GRMGKSLSPRRLLVTPARPSALCRHGRIWPAMRASGTVGLPMAPVYATHGPRTTDRPASPERGCLPDGGRWRRGSPDGAGPVHPAADRNAGRTTGHVAGK